MTADETPVKPDVVSGGAAPTATAKYEGRHRKGYLAEDPAVGEEAVALAASWGETNLEDVVAAWGTRCRLVEYSSGSIICRKCRALSWRYDDDDEAVSDADD